MTAEPATTWWQSEDDKRFWRELREKNTENYRKKPNVWTYFMHEMDNNQESFPFFVDASPPPPPPPKEINPLTFFGLPIVHGLSDTEVRKAYKRQKLLHHPDKRKCLDPGLTDDELAQQYLAAMKIADEMFDKVKTAQLRFKVIKAHLEAQSLHSQF